MEFSDVVKGYRHDHLMTQREMASRCGVTQTTLSRIETGKQKASGLTMAKIEKAMSRPIEKE